jgi:hypothetical protein
MPQLSRRDIELLVLGVGSQPGNLSRGISGLTRLQKLLYLLEAEGHVSPSADGFQFEPYKAGPYSAKLYDDLEFLENLGLVRSEITAEATPAEAAELDKLGFDELMGTERESALDDSATADAYEERRYALTDKGRARVQELLARRELDPVIEGVRKINARYASHSLSDLLHYVYTKYPAMTVESEIRDQILARRRR